MPTANQRKAMSQGYITSKQYNKLPPKMLDGIIRHNKKKGRKPGKGKKPGKKRK